MGNKKYIFRVGGILATVIVVLFFQNCGKNGVESHLSSNSQSSTLDRSSVSGGSPSEIEAQSNAQPNAKTCKVYGSNNKYIQSINSGKSVKYYKYPKSLFCENAEVNPIEEKTCVNGNDLTFKYINAECKPIVPTQLTHYVRMIWKDRLIKIHKYTYDAIKKIWIRNTVWDKNKAMTYPKQGDSGSSQRKIFDTIGFRLNSALYLADSNDTNKFQIADTDLNSLVSNLEEPGMYVESVIDVNNLDLAEDAKKFSAYDYGLMYPDLTEYLSKTEVKNAGEQPDFPANPWNKFPCNNLPKATDNAGNPTGFTDWTKVYADPDNTKIAYQCAYDTLYAVFGPNDNKGDVITGTEALEGRELFRKKFIVGLNDQGGEGPEFNLFFNHYKATSVSSVSGGTGTPCDNKAPEACEFRNPNMLFDDVAYYYQYIYGVSPSYVDIFSSNNLPNHSYSGLGFANYKSFGISGAIVAQPFVPRFDEVSYLQDPMNSVVLQSIYVKTLNNTNAKQDKASGLSHYVKFGRTELRRGYYSNRPLF
jgi:hypothetical protein